MTTSDDNLELMATANIQDEAMGDDTESREIDASEALRRIKNGEKLCGVTVRNLNLAGGFGTQVIFEHCTLIKPRFHKATFREFVGLFACKIFQGKISRGTTFEKSLKLSGSTLFDVTFSDCRFTGNVSLENVQTEGQLFFKQCQFDGKLAGWGAKFQSWINLENCEVHGQVDMRSIYCREGFNLRHSICHDEVRFRGAVIDKKVDLTETTFHGLLDFSKAKLHDFVYLENIQQGDGQTFCFDRCVADRILVEPTQLLDRLESEKNGDFATAAHEYGILKRCFEGQHRYDDEDWAFYRFKVNQRRGRTRCWKRPWTKLAQLGDLVLLDWGCGYGTNPLRAIGTAGVLMILFALVYYSGIHLFDIQTAPLAELPITHWANRLLYALITSVSVLTAGFTGDHLNSAHGWVLIPLAIEALIGTLLWGLFIVAFSRKVIR